MCGQKSDFVLYLCRTKALVLELLAAICLVKGGHEIILSAFDNFKEVCHETRRFQTLMEYFSNFEVFHIEFMVSYSLACAPLTRRTQNARRQCSPSPLPSLPSPPFGPIGKDVRLSWTGAMSAFHCLISCLPAHCILKVVDSRPARSAGRLKKSCFKTPESSCVCYKVSIFFSFKILKVHSVWLGDELKSSKNPHNANFTKIWLKQAFQS